MNDSRIPMLGADERKISLKSGPMALCRIPYSNITSEELVECDRISSMVFLEATIDERFDKRTREVFREQHILR
jgi:hypothetical protein